LLRINIVGARDLGDYASYSGHYVDRNEAYENSNGAIDPSLTQKKQRAPTYYTVDTSLSFTANQGLKITLAINNLFDYTQVKEGDSPSTWGWHIDHAHYDGLHTWGPNRGREFLATLSGEF
jgi:outer membrane receptor protein involved in Fe transport